MKVNLSITGITFKYGDKELLFMVKTVINKPNIHQILDQMALLNHYLAWKDDEYKSILWDKLEKAHEAIENTILSEEIVLLREILDLIDVIDIMDIYNYIKDVYKLVPPSSLIDEFTDQIEREGRLYRVQTFIKNEYLELAALAVALKIIIGPISYFIYLNSALVGKNLEYAGFKFIRRSKLFNSPPMVKTLGLIKKLLEQNNTQVSVIEKKLSSSELPIYILSIVIFQRLATATIIDDNKDKNLVTIVHSYASSKLNNTGDIGRVIRPKNTNIGGGGDDDTTSSVVEAYKASSDITPGKLVEINWSVESIENILSNSSNYVRDNTDQDEIMSVYKKLKVFDEISISEETIKLLAVVMKDTVNAAARKNLNLNSIKHLMATAYVFLKTIGLPELATIITSRTIITVGVSIKVNINRARLKTEDKEKLAIHFPSRKINNTQNINIGEEWINTLSTDYLEHKWVSVVDKVPSSKILPSNLKPILAKLLITLEENRDEK